MAVVGYHLLILLIAPFHRKAFQFTRGRWHWYRRLREKRDPAARYVWFHCASLGEFEQGRPLIEAFRREQPGMKVALTFFSPSGYEIRKTYPQADLVAYLPADTPRNARRFLSILAPEMAFFVKYEFWHHYMAGLKGRGIPLYLVSGIFRKEQRFFTKKPWGRWFRKSLEAFSWFFVQDCDSVALLASIGISRCTLSGDTRFDRVAALQKGSQSLPVVENFSAGKPVLVAGSTWKPDEELLVPVIREEKRLKYILVPHEVTPVNINRLKGMFITPPLLYSQAGIEEPGKYDVMIVDTVGILSSLYRYGLLAYVGGGFGKGIHNILEAATYGLPVIFGPNHRKFREACQLADAGAAFPVASRSELRTALEHLLGNERDRIRASRLAQDYVKQNQGATRLILQKIFS